MKLADHPINLFLDDERCTLSMMLPGANALYVDYFSSTEVLLTMLLNRSYYPQLVTDSHLRAMGIAPMPSPQSTPWFNWLDDWNHDEVERIVNSLYFSENTAVETLKPSQRFRVMLALGRSEFAPEYTESSFAHPRPLLKAAEQSCTSFTEAAEKLRRKKDMKMEQARFQAGCQLAEQYGVCMPRQVQYWFSNMEQMIFWLLRDVIERDKYIKRCELCGRYFIPRRNTKKYCSTKCTNKQRELDSFCGVQEARKLYIRIVSNLRDKAARMQRLKQPYCIRGDSETWYDPQKVLKQFYSDNVCYMNDLRGAYEDLQAAASPTAEQKEEFEAIRGAYLDWLQDRYDFATSLGLDRDNYW